jgi:hypothetical protein
MFAPPDCAHCGRMVRDSRREIESVRGVPRLLRYDHRTIQSSRDSYKQPESSANKQNLTKQKLNQIKSKQYRDKIPHM